MTVIELEPGLWEIVDDEGDSVFASHCEAPHCGMPIFSRDNNFIRPDCARICKECEIAYENAGMEVPETIYQLYAPPRKKTFILTCKVCGEPEVRSQPYEPGIVCSSCKAEKDRQRHRRHAKV